MTAVCFGGYHAVNVYAYGLNLRKQLIEPLRADVFMALTYRHDDNCSTVESCGVLERVKHLWPIARVEIEPMQLTKDLSQKLEALPHWTNIIAAFNRSHRTCFRNPSWDHATAAADSTPWACIHLQHTQYNTIFSPVIGLNKLNVLRQEYALSKCLRLIHSHEAATGQLYSRLVHSRLESIWLAPHPPISLMDSRCLWVPDGEDYGGLNDRHAIMNRSQAELYMARWDMILDGRVMQNNANLQSGTCCGSMSDERWLLSLTRYYRLPVCRFPQLFFLTCCNSQTWANCFRQTCHRERVLNMTLSAKSSAELGCSAQNAKLLSDPNMSLVLEGEMNFSFYESNQKHRLSIALKPGTVKSHKRPFGKGDWIPGYSSSDSR